MDAQSGSAPQEEPTATSLGVMQKLVERRKSLGLSQADVATAIGVSAGKVSRMELGEIEDLWVCDLRAYATKLGLEMVIFFDEIESDAYVLPATTGGPTTTT